MHDHTKRPSGPDGDRRLDIETSFRELLTDARGILLHGFPRGAQGVVITASARTDLGADAQQGRQRAPLMSCHV